jgi:LPXTG-motif cell wall-anchored protein
MKNIKNALNIHLILMLVLILTFNFVGLNNYVFAEDEEVSIDLNANASGDVESSTNENSINAEVKVDTNTSTEGSINTDSSSENSDSNTTTETNTEAQITGETNVDANLQANEEKLVFFVSGINSNEKGDLVATLGYNNKTDSDIGIEKSYFSDNLFSESVPEQFLTGEHEASFTIEFTGKTLDWTIETSNENVIKLNLNADGNLTVEYNASIDKTDTSEPSEEMESLPQTGEDIPYINYITGSVFVLIGMLIMYIFRKKVSNNL